MIVLPPLLLRWADQAVFSLFPPQLPAAILIGVCVAWLVHRRARWVQGITLALLALILLTQIRGWYGLLHYIDTHATPNGVGAPIHYLMTPREVLVRYDDVLVVSDSPWVWRSILLNEIPAVREAAVAQSEIVVVPDGAFAVVHPDQTILIIPSIISLFPYVRAKVAWRSIGGMRVSSGKAPQG
jgi:hypothetical protein